MATFRSDTHKPSFLLPTRFSDAWRSLYSSNLLFCKVKCLAPLSLFFLIHYFQNFHSLGLSTLDATSTIDTLHSVWSLPTPHGSVLGWAFPEVDPCMKVKMHVDIWEVILASRSREHRYETGKGRKLMPTVCMRVWLLGVTWGRCCFVPLGHCIELRLRAMSPRVKKLGYLSHLPPMISVLDMTQ